MKNPNNSTMSKIDSSLCSNCIHAKSCTLTESKRFIWSCSEFESEDLHKKHVAEKKHVTKKLKPQSENLYRKHVTEKLKPQFEF
jgi:hypothetical protein